MTEQTPLERNRLKTLQFGIGMDMLPHGFALLSAFGKLASFDEMEVRGRYRYSDAPAEYLADTGLEVGGRFTTSCGDRVPVELLAAKGWGKAERTLEIKGVKKEVTLDFTQAEIAPLNIRIPPTAEAYRFLLAGLRNGLDRQHAYGLLNLKECREITRLLEDMWLLARKRPFENAS
jgi:hypothetical protein